MPRVACPLVWGVSKNEHRKKAKGVTDRQNTNSRPSTDPKSIPGKAPPALMIAPMKDRRKPRMTPSEMK